MSDEPFVATIPYRVRFDESTPAGVLRVSALLRYAQDAAWIHSERFGFDRGWYAARGLSWLVRCAEVGVFDDVPMGEQLAVTTQVIGYRKVWARRRTDVVRPDQQLAARVLTDWVMTDARGMPTRVPAEFGVFGTDLATFAPGRVSLPPTPPEAVIDLVQVRHQDLDPMGHVNNAAYLDYFEEAAADSAAGEAAIANRPRRYRLEYLQPASPRAHLAGASWAFESGLAFRLSDESGLELLRATVGPAE